MEMGQMIQMIFSAIPDGTTRVSLLGRHSLSVQDGPNDTRALSPKGIELCHEVRGFYAHLVLNLELIGNASYYYSQMARSLITIREILLPRNFILDERLNLLASLKKIQGGAWFKAQKDTGHSDVEIIRAFLTDSSIGAGQPFKQNAANYLAWATEPYGHRLRVAFAHEVACSLAAHPYLDSDVEPGLSECQAYLFCVDDSGNVLRVIKVTPPATL
ncbi:MAG: hypothetical protein WC693_04700 [Patescibacteria group bacterium]|jgi:hypothetical protein